MEQSLVEHENYIVELREENAYQNVMYERTLVEVKGIERLGKHSA